MLGRLLFLISMLLLSGCFEITEELWINPDNSGRIRLTVGVAESLVPLVEQSQLPEGQCDEQRILGQLNQNEQVTSATVTRAVEAGMRYCTIDVGVSDLRQFNEFGRIAFEQQRPDGQYPITIDDLDDGSVRVIHDFTALRNEGGQHPEVNALGEDLVKMMFGSALAGKYLTVIAHAPKIESSNGDISEDGKTVRWRKPILDLMGSSTAPLKFEMVVQQHIGLLERLRKWLGADLSRSG